MSNQRLPLWTPPLPLFLWHLPPPWDRPQCGGGSHWGTIWEPAVSQISKPRYPPVILQGTSRYCPGIIEVSHRHPTETICKPSSASTPALIFSLAAPVATVRSKWKGCSMTAGCPSNYLCQLSFFFVMAFVCGKLSFFFVMAFHLWKIVPLFV